MSAFKLNLKPAAAFANAASEQNEVDAVTREADARARSSSPTHSGSSKPVSPVKPNDEAVDAPPKPTPFAMKKLALPTRGEEEAGQQSSRNRHTDPTVTISEGGDDSAPVTNSARAAPSLGVPGLRLGGHQRVGSESQLGSARLSSARTNNNSTDTENAPVAGGPTYRRGTIHAAPASSRGTTASAPSPRNSNTPPIPAFSLALNKIHGGSPNNGGAPRSANNNRRASVDVLSKHQLSPSAGPASPMEPFVFGRYNPEIEKSVDVDEEDEFLVAVDGLADDPKLLKAQLLEARRELLGWDIRFDTMRDHYHDQVGKLVAHMEYEHERHLHSANTHSVNYNNTVSSAHSSSPHQPTHTYRPSLPLASHRSESSAGAESPRGGYGGGRPSPAPYPSGSTARGHRNGCALMDTAVQTDITVEVLEVMIKYPQSVRGERGNTRATSPAVNNANGRLSTYRAGTLSKSKSPAASPLPMRQSTSPSVSVGATRRSAGTSSLLGSAAKIRVPACNNSDRQSTGTPMSRSILSNAGTPTANSGRMTSRKSAGGDLNASHSGSSAVGAAVPYTGRKKNSALLSVNSDVAPPSVRASTKIGGSTSVGATTAATPRASLLTSRGGSTSASSPSNRAVLQRSASPQCIQQADRPPLVIPAQLSTAAYTKPGARKFAGVAAATTPTNSKGGSATSRTHHAAFESSLSSASRGNAADGLRPLDFGGSLTTGGLSGYEMSATTSMAASPTRHQGGGSNGLSGVSSTAHSPSHHLRGDGASQKEGSNDSPPSSFAPRQIVKTPPLSSKYPPVEAQLPNKRNSLLSNSSTPSPQE